MQFSLPKGPLMRKVQIDPAMCASMLKYVAPALADATTVSGTFSADLDTCRVPLGDLAHSDLSGRLTIHAAEINSAPLLHELSVLLGREVPANLRQESVVAFRMDNGRIYHEGLEIQFPDLAIRTHGWVGLDEKLDIVADMPVPPKWLAGNTLVSQAMRNQTISLPIKGTLDKPQTRSGGTGAPQPAIHPPSGGQRDPRRTQPIVRTEEEVGGSGEWGVDSG